MPIEGVSELVQLPRLGKIKLGMKVEKPGKTPYPQATDYFVCPPEVQAVFGDKPAELEIMFPVEDPQVFAQQWLRAYSLTQGLICIGNGATSRSKIDLATGEIAGHETRDWEWREGLSCDPQECPKYLSKQCRRVMNLQIFLPEVAGLGVWQIDTTSFFSIRNINSMIKMLKGALGRCSMIPLTLALGPEEVSPLGQKKKTVQILHIKTDVKLADLARIALMPPASAIIPSPEVEEPPEDLFPGEVIEGDSRPQAGTPLEGPPDYLGAWQEIVALIKELDPDEGRIKEWWQRNYQLEVTKHDFTRSPKRPPQKYGGHMIIAFRERLKETKEAQVQEARQETLPF